MAAGLSFFSGVDLTDLRELRGADLDNILGEQGRDWAARFGWDFAPSAGTIRRFLDARSLFGYALQSGGRVVAYSYFVHEDRKALLGDLYVSERYRDAETERLLFRKTIEAAAVYPGIKRIEGQLLAIDIDLDRERFFDRPVRTYPRQFMVRERFAELRIAPRAIEGVRYVQWADRHLNPSSEIIEQSYRSHVDSLINDQYRSFAGARRFIVNTTEHPGCGEFARPASIAGELPRAKRLAGVCLGSRVAKGSGHITQLCVHPQLRRRGLGLELLRRCLGGFRTMGCDSVSLTVTTANATAVNLYEALGFETQRRYQAFVWEAG